MKRRAFPLLIAVMLLAPACLCLLKTVCILRGPANPAVYLTGERKNMFHMLAERELRDARPDDDGVRCLPDGTMARCEVDRETEVVLFRQRVFRAFADYYVHKDGNVICKSDFDLSFFMNARRICLVAILALVASMFFKLSFISKAVDSLVGFLSMAILCYIAAAAACISVPLLIMEAVSLYRLVML